ncbi:MAG: signal peptidase I [Actinomycetota bacterium]|nr:signal peptidase I [Actinomycetota bacterium]
MLVAFALAFALRTFVVQVFYIPSSSMEPTLMVDDRILVDKITYRFRDLQRGEIVVFEGDELAPIGDQARGPLEKVLHGVAQLIGIAPANARDYVKRVVGLPGDRIVIDESGKVYVNNVALDEPYVAAEDPRPYGPVIVPAGRLFFLGDNRPNSSDSRFENLGFVQRDHVVGKAFLAIWPLERAHFLRTPPYPQIPDIALGPAASTPVAVELPRRQLAPAA